MIKLWLLTVIVFAAAIVLVVGCEPLTDAEIQEISDKAASINDAVGTADNPMDAFERGWDATKLWNPYYGIGVLGIGLLKLWRKKQEVETALEEVVISVEDNKTKPANFKTTFNAVQSLKTRKMVRKIRDTV